MNVTNFKLKLAAYANRDVASFTVNGFDVLLDVINDVHREVQQKVNLARTYTKGFIQANNGGVALSGAVTNPEGTGTAVAFRVVESVWEYVTITAGTQYAEFKSIAMMAEADLRVLVPKTDEYPLYPESSPTAFPYINVSGLPTLKRRAYVSAGDQKFYLLGTTTLTWVMIKGYKQLPDFTTGTDTDTILDNYHAWMLWECLQKLNGYLKEDQRIMISQRLLEDAWDKVMNDDMNIRESYAGAHALN